MKVDLHIHSTYSDSSRSPEEIVALAKERNVSLISICDHATIGAYDTLSRICSENNIKCVLGVELGVMWYDEEIHMLAYNFDTNNEQLNTFINKQYRAIECEYIVYNMSKDYPQMSLEDYRHFEYPKDKGGWKYLYYAVSKGAAKTYEEANKTIYRKYSTPNHLSDFGECNMRDFCEMVKQAGGVPVLAHPGYLYLRNPDGFVDMLKEMKDCGIEGIECYYPSHSKTITDICVDFCKKNDMRITGGCDCHGDFDKSEGFTIGALDIYLPMLDLKGIADRVNEIGVIRPTKPNMEKQPQNTLRKEKRKMATYKERYLAGEIEFEEIDKYSYQWGMSDDERTLAQYLGLNAEEEDAWVSISEDALRELLDKQRRK